MVSQFIQIVDMNGEELSAAICSTMVPLMGDALTIVRSDGGGIVQYEVAGVAWTYEEATPRCSKDSWIASVYVSPV